MKIESLAQEGTVLVRFNNTKDQTDSGIYLVHTDMWDGGYSWKGIVEKVTKGCTQVKVGDKVRSKSYMTFQEDRPNEICLIMYEEDLLFTT